MAGCRQSVGRELAACYSDRAHDGGSGGWVPSSDDGRHADTYIPRSTDDVSGFFHRCCARTSDEPLDARIAGSHVEQHGARRPSSSYIIGPLGRSLPCRAGDVPWRWNRVMLTEGPPDPTFVLSHAVAAAVVRDAVVRDADDRLAMLRAAAAIAKGNERAASRFGYCMASAIVDELWDSLE